MEKVVEIDIVSKDDLFERYNKKVVSKKLIQYMIDNTPKFEEYDTIKVVINNKIKDQKECLPLIVEALKEEYNNNSIKYYRNNLMQLFFFFAGVITLFISTLINDTIFKQIILIGGWVFIWEMIETEIYEDMKSRKKKKIIQKLLNSEMIENKM